MIGTDRRGRFETVPVGRLRPAPGLFRTLPEPGELASLVASIRKHGVIQPILVRPAARDEFEIVCGIRRWLAAREARLGAVPAIVRELDDREALEIALAENRDRRPIADDERVRALARLETLFPTHGRRELESWIGSAAEAPASEAVEEPVLPAWMDEEPAETVANLPPPEAETPAPDETQTYWLEEIRTHGGAEADLAAPAPRRLVPQVRQFLETFTKTGLLDAIRLKAIVDELFESLEKDPPHHFLDLEYREPPRRYLPRHSLNVTKLAVWLGRARGLARPELEELALGTLLHDVGIFQVDEAAFKKRTALNDEEWALVRSHPREGQILLTREALLREVIAHVSLQPAEGVEEWRGRISRYAKIINLVDTYEAMISPRVNRLPVLPHEGLRALMDEGAKGMLDWEYVELFTRTMGIYPVGSYVRMRTGEVGVVVRANEETPALPVVRIFADASRAILAKPVLLDLSLQDPPLAFEAIARPA